MIFLSFDDQQKSYFNLSLHCIKNRRNIKCMHLQNKITFIQYQIENVTIVPRMFLHSFAVWNLSAHPDTFPYRDTVI